MRVAIVGSWREVDVQKWRLESKTGFAAACRKLGSLVVSQGHTLLVASDEKHTADFHAVEGALQALKTKEVSVAPIVVYGKRGSFERWLPKHPNLVTRQYADDSSPDIAKLLQVKEVDCVIPVGGAHNTFEAGIAAAVSGKNVMPIGYFGGAAKRIHELLHSHYASWKGLVPKDVLSTLGDAWSDYVLECVAAQLGQGLNLLIIHGHSPDRNHLKKYLESELHLPEPVLMREKFGFNKALPEKWETVTEGIDGAIAVVTPDDVGGLVENASGGVLTTLERRARQNVWLEVGWFWGRLGRDHILLLLRGDAALPSDLQGTDVVPYKKFPLSGEARNQVRQFVKFLGYRSPA